MNYLRLFLLPFSLIFLLIVLVRNKLYDWKIIKQVKLNVPVVSIGNIKTGGTGKTPFTIFLAEFLLKRNLKVAIVSGGYKKENVDEIYFITGKEQSPAIKNLGDEPFLIFTRLKNISDNFILASGGKKYSTSKITSEKYKPDVIIIDDGFQHRDLFRDIDIVLIEHPQTLQDKILLPAGNLRETSSGLKRASIVIRNNKSQIIETNDLISIKYINKGYFDLSGAQVQLDNAVYTLCGIANPHSFYSLINTDKLNILRKFEFPDHHIFKEEELEKLFTGIDKEKVIVTTEKDFVKLQCMKELFKKYRIVCLKIDVQFKKGKDIFENRIKEIIL
ncbi:MAG: tetraacyldisaccharide 4'-kinase [Bacteroidetes bacterium]|nr:tetraacyldisaccharide 4'-kinase [Bacteroidota bacterium]